MRLNIIKILLSGLAVFFMGLPLISAQEDDVERDSKEEKKAEKWYEDLGYSAALEAYGNKPDGSYDLEDLIKIAESHRMNADYYNAQKWYGQVVKKTDEPIYKLYYAQALQANGHYEAAREFFLDYDTEAAKGLEAGETADRRGEMGAQACAAIQNFRYAKDIKIRNVAELNTKKLDFSPSYVDGGLIFVSTRDNENMAKRKDTWINDNFMELFYAGQGGVAGVYAKPTSFSPEINTKYHEGPMTMAKDGKTMFFTRNNYNKGKRGRNKRKITMLKIYSADLNSDEEWGGLKELGFNSDEYHSCHPSLSADGQRLYFSSNKNGGFGGMDIYMSELNDGNWSDPVNLGEEVNTKGNEVFPFVHDSGVLYYASNGLPGLGGLDIFTTSSLVKNGETHWSNVSNLGLPYNSKKDDFGFIMNEEGTSGYLTSSRSGGKGADDIYSWASSDEPINLDEEDLLVTGIMGVCDEITGEKIAGAKVVAFEDVEDEVVVQEDNGYILGLKPATKKGDYVLSIKKANKVSGASEVFTTDENGEFEYKMKPGKNYLFKVVKMGYADATDAYETKVSAYTTSISHCIPMAKRSCTTLKGQVFNAVCKDKNIPVAKVTLLNKCTGELTQIESGSDGSYEFCLECGCEYELLGTKTNFSQDKQRVSLISKNCDETIVQNLNLTFGLFDDFASNPTPQNGNYPPNGGYPQNPGAYMSNNFGGNYNGNMMGRSIVLEKVYYDFNKYAIRPDAAQELDKIVQLLREFPSMEIELSSHTDARGTDKYNEILSQNRANAAVQYVISRGISASRLSAKGYGERYTRNRCKDEVDCTEEHHQYNRRTEVKITSFARYNEVRVDYKDNAPSVIDKADPSRKWIWD
jgi:outer membrane protein OmpA-like peptidoglycan-associated protein